MKSKNIVVVGDSVVHGECDELHGGWVSRLRMRLIEEKGREDVFYNLGVRGDGVRNVLNRLPEIAIRGNPHKRENKRKVPDILVFAVGLNDSAEILGKGSFTDLRTFRENLYTVLKTAALLSDVLFVGMHPVNELSMPYQKLMYTVERQSQYNRAIAQLCEQLGIPYLDILESWLKKEDWRSLLSPDGLHPNPNGYKEIADTVFDWQSFMELLK